MNITEKKTHKRDGFREDVREGPRSSALWSSAPILFLQEQIKDIIIIEIHNDMRRRRLLVPVSEIHS